MEFILELILEIIMEPIVEGYAFAMMRFTDKNKSINKEKVKCFVVLECIVLFILFIVGGVMLLETNGESVFGKIFMFISLGVSLSQIIVGCILLKKSKKDKEK